jgi:hypothetical protein
VAGRIAAPATGLDDQEERTVAVLLIDVAVGKRGA